MIFRFILAYDKNYITISLIRQVTTALYTAIETIFVFFNKWYSGFLMLSVTIHNPFELRNQANKAIFFVFHITILCSYIHRYKKRLYSFFIDPVLYVYTNERAAFFSICDDLQFVLRCRKRERCVSPFALKTSVFQ